LEELMEYTFISIIALAALFTASPILINFFSNALDSIANATGLSESQQSLVETALLLMLIMFFLLGVYVMWKAVSKKFLN